MVVGVVLGIVVEINVLGSSSKNSKCHRNRNHNSNNMV